MARAVVPVAGGLVAIAVIGLILWAAAAWMASRGDPPEAVAPTQLRLGSAESVAETIDESGPILWPGLDTRNGEVSLVLDHTGNDPTRGWQLYYAHPADKTVSCAVTQIQDTSKFLDCEDREIEVSDLAPPRHERPVLEEDQTTLTIDLVDRGGVQGG